MIVFHWGNANAKNRQSRTGTEPRAFLPTVDWATHITTMIFAELRSWFLTQTFERTEGEPLTQ